MNGVLTALLTTLVVAPAPARAVRHRIVLDGRFDDWADVTPACEAARARDGGGSSTPGRSAGAVDIGRVWLAEDEERFYLSFEIVGEARLLAESALRLCLDIDDDAATGFLVWPLGVDFSWEFDRCRGVFHDGGRATDVSWRETGFTILPAHAATRFELCFDRAARLDGEHLLFPGGASRLLFEGAASCAGPIEYAFERGDPLAPLETIPLEKADPRACRLLTYNVRRDGLFDPGRTASFARILRAVDPDVIAFQELYLHDAGETRERLEEWLGGEWNASRSGDLIVAARRPILSMRPLAGNRAAAFAVSSCLDGARDLTLVDAHLSCCAHEPERLAQAAAIRAFLREICAAADPSAPAIPTVVAGDLNLVATSAPLDTLLDASDLRDLTPREPARPFACTWIPATDDYSPARLDFVLIQEADLRPIREIVLRTDTLSPETLESHGLHAHDTQIASDHLPVFIDLLPAETVVPPPAMPWRLALAGPNPASTEVHLTLQVSESARRVRGVLMTSVRNCAGRTIARLSSTPLVPGLHELLWDCTTAQGRPAHAGIYWICTVNTAEPHASITPQSIPVVLIR